MHTKYTLSPIENAYNQIKKPWYLGSKTVSKRYDTSSKIIIIIEQARPRLRQKA